MQNKSPNQLTQQDLQTGVAILQVFHLANKIAQESAEVQYKLDTYLATHQELSAWHDSLCADMHPNHVPGVVGVVGVVDVVA